MKKSTILSICLLIVIFLIAIASEACEFVDVCSSCTYTTIQEAVDYVECADNNNNYTIRVAEGTYVENVIITKCGSSPYGAKNITIEGGWNESFTEHDSQQYSTIVDGNHQARVFYIDPEEADLTITIKDLTIQNGYGEDFGLYGGGIGAETANNSYNLFITIINNIIQYNDALHDAGGISIRPFLGNIEAVINNNIIHGNSAPDYDTGGVLLNSADGDLTVTMENNEIFNNTARFEAGVLFYARNNTEGRTIANLSNNHIHDNYITDCINHAGKLSTGGGLGIHIRKNHIMDLTLNNNIIENNQATTGAGMYVHVFQEDGDRAQLRVMSHNNIIRNNIIPNGSKGGVDCRNLIQPPGYAPDEYSAIGGGVTINIDKTLNEQSVFTFNNDTITGNTLYVDTLNDLALETGDRGKAFISVENSTIGKMNKYSERSGQKVTYEGDLIPDIAADDFNDGDDNGWTRKSGTWGVESGEYVEPFDPLDNSTCLFSLIRLETQKEMIIEAEAKEIGDNPLNFKNFFIVFAYDEDAGKAYWAGAGIGGNQWLVEEIDLATCGCNVLASQPQTPGSIEINRWYDMRVEIKEVEVGGETFGKVELYVDGEEVEKVSYIFDDPVKFPNGMPTGNIGLGGYSNHAHFDNFGTTLFWPVADPGAPLAGCPVIVGSNCYSTLQEAYDAAFDGDTMQSQAVRFMEDFYADYNKSVTLAGGYDCNYTLTIDNTTLNGDMSISDGTVTIENFVVE